MRSITNLANHFDDLFRDLNRYTVGFEPTFRMLDKVGKSITDSYPPYDLEKLENDGYRLSMAVAGFKNNDLNVSIQNGVLEIVGKSNKDGVEKEYLHNGIARRDFKRVFYLNAWVDITKCILSDGILTIDFEQKLPESMLPKKINISVPENLEKISVKTD